MKLTTLALTLFASMALSASAIAMPLSFDWEFDIGPDSTSGAGGLIKGTIDGLVEGSNVGTGLITVTVTDTPSGLFEGTSDWTFADTSLGPSGNALTVALGLVTFADAVFLNLDGDELYFGRYGGFYPELAGGTAPFEDWYNQAGQTVFTPHAVATVPEPATLALFGLGLAALGASARRKKAA